MKLKGFNWNQQQSDEGIFISIWFIRRLMPGNRRMVPYGEILVGICSWQSSLIYNFPQHTSISYKRQRILSIRFHRVRSVVIDSYVIDSSFGELIVSIWISNQVILRQRAPIMHSYILILTCIHLSSSIKPVHTHVWITHMSWTVTCIKQFRCMMTSSNGNIFRVTGPLWGQFTGHQWKYPHKGQ